MKFKYYLKGFGAGVLFATIVLSVSFLLRAGKNTGMTDAQIMARARELGMETVGSTEETESAQELTKELIKETTAATETVAEPVDSVISESQETETTALGQETEPEITEDTKIVIEIPFGMNSGEICQILEEAGVVESADEMEKYLKENGMTVSVRAGSYEFSRGMSIQAIVEKMCW